MSLKNALVVCGLLLAVAAYCLYEPSLVGYSSTSTRRIQFAAASFKLADFVASAASFIGIGSYVNYCRQFHHRLAHFYVKPCPEVTETDDTFDGVHVRVYEPVNRKGILPGFVYFHGGGFIFGDLDFSAEEVRRLCKETNSVVVSVNYRLAPESPFPAAFEDGVTATKYFIKNAAKYKVDTKRIAVGGDGAGGNLAAAVTLQLRDDGVQPSIKLQVLLYPMLQGIDFRLPSMMQYEHGPIVTRSAMAYCRAMYIDGNSKMVHAYLNNDHVAPRVKQMGVSFLNISRLPEKYTAGYKKPNTKTGDDKLWQEMKGKLFDPRYSPLVAASLKNLPPAYVFTAEHDLLRDEGFLYVYRLREAGVKVEHVHSDIGIHHLLKMVNYIPEAEAAFLQMTKFVSQSLKVIRK